VSATDSNAMNGTGGDSTHGGDGISSAAIEDIESTPTNAPNIPSWNVEDMTTSALRFLSTASPETIAGIAIGLAACTYFILGKIGLLLIGAFGGIVLHATWESHNSSASVVEAERREKGLDILKRILDTRESQIQEEEDNDAKEELGVNFEGFRHESAAALDELVDAVIRDYVKWWYHPILPKENVFPSASRLTFTKLVLSVSNHLSRKRPADAFLDFLTHSTSIIVVFLGELASALSISQGSEVPARDAVYAYLSANPESNLASVLNEKQQARKFKMVAEDILENFLDQAAYNCDPARIFLREILAGVVLEMTLRTCSKPEWINGWIVYLLEEGEPDISQAIDAGMGNGFSTPFDVIDGNVGNVGLAKSSKSQAVKQEEKKHKKRLSRAEEAMEEATEEVRRLSQMIADEEGKKCQSFEKVLEQEPKQIVQAIEQGARLMELETASLSRPTSKIMLDTEPLADPITPIRSSPVADNYGMSPESASPTASIIPRQSAPSFTSFDQILPQSTPPALQESPSLPRRKTVSLTLHNANIVIYDDSTAADKGKMRTKPSGDYLVQIEPASSDFPGWMIMRRYSDFETLHEVLRRIANISGVAAFAEQHHTLPNWKEHTKASLRGELERYLRDACWYQSLAESEGMKRFLEKDQGQPNANGKPGFPGLGWPTPSAFENMGKGVLDVLSSAPKGVADGGKAIGGGITGVFSNIGNLGQKKVNGGSMNVSTHHSGRSSTTSIPRMDSTASISSRKGRVSEDNLLATPVVHTQPLKIAPMERGPSYNSIAEGEIERAPRASSARSSISGRQSTTHSRDPSRAPSKRETPISSPIHQNLDEVRLPPPPSSIPNDYGSQSEEPSLPRRDSNTPTTRTSTSTAPSQQSPGRSSNPGRRPSVPVIPTPRKPRKEPAPLTEAETRQAVELIFAVVNELYTLSSAWNIRRTLLNAAKTFLLRPNNPSLSSIQALIQDSIIVSNTSDSGIAANIRKLRENTLPTEEELKSWPPEISTEEKERLRTKARKLLVERGVPAALTGVMGQAATAEAMGRVFDCLQIEEVSRGLIFGLLLQAVRAVAH